ncbi:MAG: hypothetical protein CMJ81_22055 [Planctomycetaceae bacterium]|nr:hypothetical protein [Planctomycetaceae bacterium]
MTPKRLLRTKTLALLLLTHCAAPTLILADPAPVPTDLVWHVEQATGNMVRWTVRMSGFDPVKQVREGGPALLSDMNHNVGRAIDGLLKGETVTGKRTPPQTLETLRSVLFATLDNESGFPAMYMADREKTVCSAHDIREAVQALLELVIRRGDQPALERLEKLLDTLLNITDEQGAYRPQTIARIPLLAANSHPEDGAAFSDDGDRVYTRGGSDGFDYPQATTVDRGRLIMALVQVYQHTHNERALELARRFVQRVRSRSFSAEGQLLQDAGSHTHSITGTVHGLAAYAALTRDLDTLEHARKIFDVGLAASRSSFGWSDENVWRGRIVDRGEINNTGDMIQTAIHLGQAGHPRYFEVAERMVRSHVLPSQWLHGQEYHPPEPAVKGVYKTFPVLAVGGWGFPGVTDRHIPGAGSDILDITQGGIQCLWAVHHHSVTHDGSAVRVNMAFSRETPAARVESHLPREGRLAVTLKQRASLWFRKPSWLTWDQLTVTVAERPLPVVRVGAWAVTSLQDAGTRLDVTYPLVRRQQQEWINRKRYRFVLEGDTIVAMSPRGIYAPMFAPLDD